MPRNKLIDLNNALFEQLERLTEAETPEALDLELKRSKAICGVGRIIVDNAQVALDAQKHIDEYEIGKDDRSEMLQITSGK